MDLFEYLMIDKDHTRVRQMCTKWITKGKWPKLEEIYVGTFQINQELKKGLEAHQCIDIILSDCQAFEYFYMDNIKASKLDLALRNKKVR